MFVSLEGIDRAGKSTQAAMLVEALGSDALVVREPGGTAVGERLRELLKDPRCELDPRAELLLFGAARAELVAEVIRPALEAGRDVVCDRFADSTLAYQGAGRGLGAAASAVNDVATAGCLPDLTVLLWIEPERAPRRGAGGDRFEDEGVEFQRRVAAAYREIAEREPGRVVTIDADRPPEAVHADVLAAVKARRA